MWFRSPGHRTALVSLLGLLQGIAGAAHAQDAGGEIILEEIIVTARKRMENIQDTPVSVTAFTAASMERLGIEDIADVAKRTPGLQYGDFGDIKLSPTTLRGVIGGAGSAGSDPAVGYYVDEVFVGQGAGANLDLYDIERVEVLRGPQGTLFGRNTIGGVISLTTKRPTQDPEASFQAQYGNYDFLRLATSVSGGVSETVAAKLSVIRERRDGTMRNDFLDRDANTQGSLSLRGQVAAALGPETDLLLTGEYRNVDQRPLAYETLRYNNATTLPNVIDLFGHPRNTDPGDRHVFLDDANKETLDAYGLSARLETSFDDLDLTSITSYRWHDYFSRADTDRSPVKFLYDGDPEKVDRFSEELRLGRQGETFDWMTGLYYYRQVARNQSFVEVGSDLATLLEAPELAGLVTGSDAKMRTTSLAGFASLTWKASTAFDITGGARLTRDKKTINYVQNDPIDLLGGTSSLQGSDNWTRLTPTLNARYRFNDDVMGYATVSSGFKSGGYNDALGDADGIAFGPETLWNYELGLKSDLFDRRVTANIALFYMDWKEIQITQDDPRTPLYDPVISNAGAAHSKGIELEVNARPVQPLWIGFNASLQQAEFDEGTIPARPPAQPIRLNKVPQTPRYTASLFAEYTVPLTGLGDLSVMGEVVARGTSYLTLDNQADGRVGAHRLVNARITLAADSGWRLALWGKNLTDTDYHTRLFDLYNTDEVGQKLVMLGDPRTYGIELRVDF